MQPCILRCECCEVMFKRSFEQLPESFEGPVCDDCEAATSFEIHLDLRDPPNSSFSGGFFGFDLGHIFKNDSDTIVDGILRSNGALEQSDDLLDWHPVPNGEEPTMMYIRPILY